MCIFGSAVGSLYCFNLQLVSYDGYMSSRRFVCGEALQSTCLADPRKLKHLLEINVLCL